MSNTEDKQLTPHEFYLKYWKIIDKDGIPHPPAYRESDKKYLNHMYRLIQEPANGRKTAPLTAKIMHNQLINNKSRRPRTNQKQR